MKHTVRGISALIQLRQAAILFHSLFPSLTLRFNFIELPLLCSALRCFSMNFLCWAAVKSQMPGAFPAASQEIQIKMPFACRAELSMGAIFVSPLSLNLVWIGIVSRFIILTVQPCKTQTQRSILKKREHFFRPCSVIRHNLNHNLYILFAVLNLFNGIVNSRASIPGFKPCELGSGKADFTRWLAVRGRRR